VIGALPDTPIFNKLGCEDWRELFVLCSFPNRRVSERFDERFDEISLFSEVSKQNKIDVFVVKFYNVENRLQFKKNATE
jgi:hypothetical protein